MEARVALRDVPENYPVVRLFRLCDIGLMRLGRGGLESDWTHVVVIAVVNVSFLWVF